METENVGGQTAAKSLEEILASIPPESRAAVRAALQLETTPVQQPPVELTEEQKAAKRAERQRFEEAIANLNRELGDTGGPSTASGVSARESALFTSLLAADERRIKALQETALQRSNNTSEQMAKALNKPAAWNHDANGAKRADIWLQQIETYAHAFNIEPQDILPSYLGNQIATLYYDHINAWKLQGKSPTWSEICTVFKNIVGQRTDVEESKALDDLVQHRIKQLHTQSVATYRVKLQHKLMIIGTIPVACVLTATVLSYT